MSDVFESDRAWRSNIELGSKALLIALWREHPSIMRHLGAQRP